MICRLSLSIPKKHFDFIELLMVSIPYHMIVKAFTTINLIRSKNKYVRDYMSVLNIFSRLGLFMAPSCACGTSVSQKFIGTYYCSRRILTIPHTDKSFFPNYDWYICRDCYQSNHYHCGEFVPIKSWQEMPTASENIQLSHLLGDWNRLIVPKAVKEAKAKWEIYVNELTDEKGSVRDLGKLISKGLVWTNENHSCLHFEIDDVKIKIGAKGNATIRVSEKIVASMDLFEQKFIKKSKFYEIYLSTKIVQYTCDRISIKRNFDFLLRCEKIIRKSANSNFIHNTETKIRECSNCLKVKIKPSERNHRGHSSFSLSTSDALDGEVPFRPPRTPRGNKKHWKEW